MLGSQIANSRLKPPTSSQACRAMPTIWSSSQSWRCHCDRLLPARQSFASQGARQNLGFKGARFSWVQTRHGQRWIQAWRVPSLSEGGEDRHRPTEAEKLLQAFQQQQQQCIGSEYGEGFMQYRLSGEALHLDVDTLNERLQLKGAERMRTAMRPDEAFGMIFSWEGVVADMRRVQERAWHKLAESEGHRLPSLERRIFHIRPERAVMDVLQWTRDWGTAQRLAFELGENLTREFATLDSPLPGVLEWLLALKSVRVPCALVSALDRVSMDAVLERMGLRHHFSALVCSEDGMETMSQRYLSAAIKLNRPPKDCVVFESNPLGIAAAHNCSCKAVAVQGTHPAYKLGQADLTCSSLSELSVYNIRRLFATRGSDFMDKKKAFVASRGGPPRGGGSRWRVANGTVEPD